MKRSSNRRGFTLIELMTVMVIISLLAAIAVPNFMNAKIRAQAARSVAEEELIAWALESYFVDRDEYPANREEGLSQLGDLTPLTTPVPYMSSLPEDVFLAPTKHERAWFIHSVRKGDRSYTYVNLLQTNGERVPLVPFGRSGSANYGIRGLGPSYHGEIDTLNSVTLVDYNSSNGIVSLGTINTFGP